MTTKYYRPNTLGEANKIMLDGGGVAIYGLNAKKAIPFGGNIIDLQDCNLIQVEQVEDALLVGSSVTLQKLIESGQLPSYLLSLVIGEERQNVRNMVTLADVIMHGTGTSKLLGALVALDSELCIYGNKENVKVGDYISSPTNGLIEKIIIPTSADLAYESVSRTPQDSPIVISFLAKWKNGRVRLVLGGHGVRPTLVVDGAGLAGIELAAASAFANASDSKASAQYRSEMSKLLTLKSISKLESK